MFFEWLTDNISSIVIVGVIVGICAAIVIKGIRNIARGKSSCGCGCSDCSMGCAIHDLEEYASKKQ